MGTIPSSPLSLRWSKTLRRKDSQPVKMATLSQKSVSVSQLSGGNVAADKLVALGLGGGSASNIKVRSVNIAAGGGAAGGVAKGGNSLKMAMMSLGGSGSHILAKELAVSPGSVVLSREKEKLALQELNDRFASYIERVRFLEADNKRLQGIITVLTVKFEELDATLRALYEAELLAARKALDQTTTAKAAVELKVAGLEAKVAELTVLYRAEYEAHVVTKESVPALEKMISERDAQIDFLTKNVNSMEIELSRLKVQITTMQKDLAFAKQSGDAEVVARVELESIIATKDDEIAFLTNMYEEKVKALMSIDLGSDAFAAAFSNELALALRDIRAEYESIMEATRTQDVDAWYKAKFNEVMQSTMRATADLANAKAELSALRVKYQDVVAMVTSLKAQLAGASERILSLQAEMAAAAAAAQLSIDEREATILALRASVTEYVIELRGLTDIKLALDAEIATYKRLLAGEESRFAQLIGGGDIGVGGSTICGGGISVGGGGMSVGGGGGMSVGGGSGMSVGGGGGVSVSSQNISVGGQLISGGGIAGGSSISGQGISEAVGGYSVTSISRSSSASSVSSQQISGGGIAGGLSVTSQPL